MCRRGSEIRAVVSVRWIALDGMCLLAVSAGDEAGDGSVPIWGSTDHAREDAVLGRGTREAAGWIPDGFDIGYRRGGLSPGRRGGRAEADPADDTGAAGSGSRADAEAARAETGSEGLGMSIGFPCNSRPRRRGRPRNEDRPLEDPNAPKPTPTGLDISLNQASFLGGLQRGRRQAEDALPVDHRLGKLVALRQTWAEVGLLAVAEADGWLEQLAELHERELSEAIGREANNETR